MRDSHPPPLVTAGGGRHSPSNVRRHGELPKKFIPFLPHPPHHREKNPQRNRFHRRVSLFLIIHLYSPSRTRFQRTEKRNLHSPIREKECWALNPTLVVSVGSSICDKSTPSFASTQLQGDNCTLTVEFCASPSRPARSVRDHGLFLNDTLSLSARAPDLRFDILISSDSRDPIREPASPATHLSRSHNNNHPQGSIRLSSQPLPL